MTSACKLYVGVHVLLCDVAWEKNVLSLKSRLTHEAEALVGSFSLAHARR